MPLLKQPEIVEVWERAEQGHANAYRCGADDGHSYYVKSQGATWHWVSMKHSGLAAYHQQLQNHNLQGSTMKREIPKYWLIFRLHLSSIENQEQVPIVHPDI